MYSLHGAFLNGSAHQYSLIRYSDLVSDTKQVLRRVEKFLDLEPFKYSLSGITGEDHNDADAYGIAGMHKVRTTIKRIDPDPETVLSPYAMARCGLEDFWS